MRHHVRYGVVNILYRHEVTLYELYDNIQMIISMSPRDIKVVSANNTYAYGRSDDYHSCECFLSDRDAGSTNRVQMMGLV